MLSRSAVRFAERWHYSVGFEYGIDFALWTLERDGLVAAPFDRHPSSMPNVRIIEPLINQPEEASSEQHFPPVYHLQPFGFNRDNWLVWFNRLILNVIEEKKRMQRAPYPAAYLALIDPAALHPGSEKLRSQLRVNYQHYHRIASQRRRFERATAELHKGAGRGRQVWRMMNQRRGNLPPVHYFLVGYPFPVIHAVKPSTVILSFGAQVPPVTEYNHALVKGLQLLQD